MLHSIKKGTGKNTIIFIHGNSQSSLVWEDFFEIEQLNKNYNLIAVDLPGHGQSYRSTKPEEDYALKGLANHFLNFAKQFEDKPYVLVGNSLGSNVISEIATQLKNCMGILITGSCVIGKGLKVQDILLPNPDASYGFLPNPTDEQINLMIEACGQYSNDNKSLIKKEFTNTDSNLRLCIGKSIIENNFSDEIQNLVDSKIPLAFVFGKDEKICNINYLDNIELNKWKSKVHLIENSGHFSHLDQPQKLAQIIDDFAKDCF